MSQQLLRVVTRDSFGGPDVLRLVESQRPSPVPAEVLVRRRWGSGSRTWTTRPSRLSRSRTWTATARRTCGLQGRRRSLLRHQHDLVFQFDYVGDPERVVIDLTDSHIWDASTVAALDAIETKYARHGKRVEIVGLNASSAARHRRLSGQLGEGH